MARLNKPDDAPGVADVIESVEREAFTEATATPGPAPKSAKEKPAPKKKAAEGKPGGFLVYIGPSILGVIQSGTIFAGDGDAAVKAAVEKFPLVKALLIPGHRLAADRIKVKTPGNSLYENYRNLAALVKSN